MSYKITQSVLVFIVLLLPVVALAQYKPLVGIPGVDPNADFNAYINALYTISIGIAALLAVIKIIIAGVKWMLTDIVTSKQEAKSDITNATIGLIIVIAAVLILNVINPNLTTTSVFVSQINERAPSVTPTESAGPPLNPGEEQVSLPNTPESEQNCTDPQGQYRGTWYETNNADNGWCVLPEGSISVKGDDVTCAKDTSSATGYNCDEAKATCEASGGSWRDTKSSFAGAIQDNKIDCLEPEVTTSSCSNVTECDSLKTECTARSGSWKFGTINGVADSSTIICID
jgi:hypothetical protein